MKKRLIASTRRVLAVDDDQDMLGLLAKVLERAGFEVGVASDGPEALRYVDAEHPDLMVLDLTMPRMSGFKVLEELRRRDRAPRVVCLTGRTDQTPKERALQLGADEYLTKPFGLKQIVEVVSGVSRRDDAEQRLHRRATLDKLSWT